MDLTHGGDGLCYNAFKNWRPEVDKFTTVAMNKGRWFDTVEIAEEEGRKFLEMYPDVDEITIVRGPVKVLRREEKKDGPTRVPEENS